VNKSICFAVLCLSVALADSARADDSWVGQTVLLKLPADPVGRPAPKSGERVRLGKLDEIGFKVEAEDGDWLRVRQDGAARWVTKAEVVRLDEAVDRFTEQIRVKPTGAAYCRRGRAWLLRGDPDKAAADFTEAIDLDAKDAVAHYYRAIARQDKKQYDKAIENFNEAARLSGEAEASIVHARLSELLWRLGRQDDAEKVLKEAIRAAGPEHPEWRMRLGEWYLRTGKGEPAEKIFNELAPLFKVTDKSLTALATAGVPESVVAKLKSMKDTGYGTRGTFLADLGESLEKDDLDRFRDKIAQGSVFPDGYGPAHLHVAYRLLRTPQPKAEQLQDAQLHLRLAIRFNQEPEAAQARFVLARLLRALNQPEEAERILVEAVRVGGDLHPEWRVELADWHRQEGKREQARAEYEATILALENAVKDNVHDNERRLRLIQSLRMLGLVRCSLGDYQKGKEALDRAIELCNTGRLLTQDQAIANRYKVEVGQLLLAQYDSTANDPATPPAERFGKLELALSLFPNQPEVLKRLAASMKLTGPEADAARKKIQDMIDHGTRSAVVYMIWGNYQWEKGNIAESKHYWEKAMAMDDWPAEVANNLAWVTAFHDKPPDLKRALALVDAALQKEPNRPEFRGTRGHILAKMDRFREALAELEAAKAAYAKDPRQARPLYERLAEVCSKLGMEADAKHYKELADKAASESAKPAPKP
jgi:tetratricopeptide (TPR) repeat protein